jgi:hypothetical protein
MGVVTMRVSSDEISLSTKPHRLTSMFCEVRLIFFLKKGICQAPV